VLVDYWHVPMVLFAQAVCPPLLFSVNVLDSDWMAQPTYSALLREY
jgi:hypothetical protein